LPSGRRHGRHHHHQARPARRRRRSRCGPDEIGSLLDDDWPDPVNSFALRAPATCEREMRKPAGRHQSSACKRAAEVATATAALVLSCLSFGFARDAATREEALSAGDCRKTALGTGRGHATGGESVIWPTAARGLPRQQFRSARGAPPSFCLAQSRQATRADRPSRRRPNRVGRLSSQGGFLTQVALPEVGKLYTTGAHLPLQSGHVRIHRGREVWACRLARTFASIALPNLLWSSTESGR
jgi:hypothetical protein